MIKKFLLPMLAISLCISTAAAEETTTENGETPKEKVEKAPLRANFKRVALELSSTEVKNAKEYENSPNSKLSADGETIIKGVFDFVLEYEQPTYQWNNSVFMEYGKTKLKPASGPDTSTENADKILLTTDYSAKVWKYEEADVGPFASLGYQTEFEPNDGVPRTKTFRGMGGLKLFNGTYIKELYAAWVQELDLTYDEEDSKSAYEIGIEAEYPLREGVKFQLESYFRDYFMYSRYVGTDFKYEFSLIGRMDVKINHTLSLAPYIQYFRAQDRQSGVYGSNFMIGLSLAYADLFNL